MKTFPGKLLLFGEYTVLLGGQALAIPLPKYAGHWAFSKPAAGRPLWPFFHFLRQEQSRLSVSLDLDLLSKELAAGLHFNSSIPAGYGLGSSGALCAALYYRYAEERIGVEDATQQDELRRQLAGLEGFFHGNSSGADPLICYLQQPLLLVKGKAERVRPKPSERGTYTFFLLDTRKLRRTAPLVERFRAYCEQKPFRQMAEQLWAPLSERATRQYLQGEASALRATMAELSAVQFEYLKPWIPEAVRPFWRKGLDSGQYSMKLCGAGGGGFLLGYGRKDIAQLIEDDPQLIALDKT